MSNVIIHSGDPKSGEGQVVAASNPSPAVRTGGLGKRLAWLGGLGVVAAAGIALAVGLGAVRPGNAKGASESAQGSSESAGGDEKGIDVVATNPYRSPSVRLSVKQLLWVEAFFETDLRAQLAGQVAKVPRSVGAKVKAGDLLVQLDRPDLESELRLQYSALDQALARVRTAEAKLDEAKAAYEQAVANDKSAAARLRYRISVRDRIKGLVDSNSVARKVYDEELDHYEAAREFKYSTEAAIGYAKARKVAAEAEIKETESKVQVVRSEIDKAAAMLGFARITAPFDGEVIRRNVVPGTFVQNASTAHTEPVISIQRSDIVTVVMRVPDNYASYISLDTEAVLTFDDLPGVTLVGKVTRFSPSIRDKDRTLRVEVDLWNDPTPGSYEKYVAKYYSNLATPLTVSGLNAVALAAAAEDVAEKNAKDVRDPLPMVPKVTGATSSVKLIPGMSGFMRLNLQEFKNSYVLPSGAVYTVGGKPYILVVKDGKSHRIPVRIQVRDGRWTKVALILQEGNPQEGKRELLGDLTGKEQVIVSRQVEVGDNADVSVTMRKANEILPGQH